jgi:hypothetical protein
VRARGLRVAGTAVEASVDASGRATLTGLPPGLEIS